MMDYDTPLYQHEREVWDENKCRRMSRRRRVNGQRMPFPGYIGSTFGEFRYNGGCERGGQWWQGERRPLPQIHADYQIVWVPTWGYRIKLRVAVTVK
jgi:hypothetical protein